MNTKFKMIALALVALLAITGCSNIDNINSGNDWGREISSFCVERKSWIMRQAPTVSPELRVWTYMETMLNGDTVIGGINCMGIQSRSWKEGESIPQNWVSTGQYLGQEGQKIYRFSNKGITRELVVDLALKVDDSVMLSDDVSLTVDAITYSVLSGATDRRERKCIHLFYGGSEIDTWAEDVGSLRYGIEKTDYKSLGKVEELVRCSIGDIIIFDKSSSVIE